MFETIAKRNGTVVPFDPQKITTAILKAGQATGEFDEKTARRISRIVVAKAVKSLDQAGVEAIQDIVEVTLMENGYYRTAKAYILYREQHAKIRKVNELLGLNLVNDYLGKSDWRVKENSNMDYSLQGLNNYLAGHIVSTYWLNQIYPPEVREAHTGGDIHIHDLNSLSPYCVGWDLADLLVKGFRGVSQKAESGPAKHFRSVLGQIYNFLYTLQGEAAGAMALSHFDTLLAPFVRFDNLAYKQVKQGIQEFIFNLNTPTRVGFQTPFSNLTLDLRPPEFMSKERVVYGGKYLDMTYGEFAEEMVMINRAFAEVMTEGDAAGKIFTFPIPTYQVTEDFPWDDPDFQGIWEMTAKFGLPYFANYVNSGMNPEDARSMCCRLNLNLKELQKRNGGLFSSSPLTGSIGVVTINLPRLALLSSNSKGFLNQLREKIRIAVTSLETKRKVLERFTEEGLYPYSRFYLAEVKKRFGKYWANHFSTIGIIGMHEALMHLGLDGIHTDKGKDFALETLRFIKGEIARYQEETGNLYNLEATPAEGASYRLAQRDRKLFNTEADIYTNSTNLPVDFTDDLAFSLDHQESLQKEYTGGTVFHIFLGEKIQAEHAKTLVKKVITTYSLPYVTLSPTFSICPRDGYLAGEEPVCPKCGGKADVYSRIVGYYRPVNQWNEGKQLEFVRRKAYAA